MHVNIVRDGIVHTDDGSHDDNSEPETFVP